MSLRDQLHGKIPDKDLERLSNRFDIIGDIAIVNVSEELEKYKHQIADAIMNRMHNVNTVLNKISKLEGDRRIAELEILAGESTETVHKESGFIYRIDLEQSFYNPRLGFERKRIASQVKSEESVLIPFAGVGPFVIPSAAAGALVVAVEMNPFACISLTENCRLNKVEGSVHVIKADANDIKEILRCDFNRAIIPTPYGMDHFLESFSSMVRSGGYIHFYTFKVKEQIPELIKGYERMGFEVEFYRRCGNVAPGVSRWVFDLKKDW